MKHSYIWMSMGYIGDGMDNQKENEIKEFILDIDRRLERIEKALMGDNLGTTGLVNRMSKAEDRLEKLEVKWARIFWYVMGLGSATAFIVELVMGLIQ